MKNSLAPSEPSKSPGDVNEAARKEDLKMLQNERTRRTPILRKFQSAAVFRGRRIQLRLVFVVTQT